MNKVFTTAIKHVELFIKGKKKNISVKGIVDEKGCWKCCSHAPDKDGYRRIKYFGKNTRIHRIVFKIYNGQLSEDLDVCHSCDVRSCFNPDHLTAEPHKVNMQHMVERNRQASGETNPNSKLTEIAIVDIRTSMLSIKELAKKYNVTSTTIQKVLKYKTWKAINCEETSNRESSAMGKNSVNPHIIQRKKAA